jgi:hypothetical protein
MFGEGRPSNDLAEVGVLVRMFDGMDDGAHGKPWLPCPLTGAWCSDHVPGERWAGSVINSAVRKLYSHGGGFILRPTETKVMCAYPADGNSQGVTCQPGQKRRDRAPLTGCTPGCVQSCTDLDYGCSFPPNRLQDALVSQLSKSYNGRARAYNEIVFDVLEIQRNLPNSIQAGFYMTHSSNRERAAAQKAHADFLAAYGLTELDVPMVVLDLTDAPDATDAPFVLEDDWVCTQWCPNPSQPRNPFLHPELVGHMPAQTVWGPGSG